MAPDAEAVRPPRRWPRRLLIGLNIFVAFCLLVTASGYLYFRYRMGQIPKVDVCKALRNCGNDDAGKAMNVLLVGSDSRGSLSKADQKRYGSAADAGGQRSDTIIILHVDPKASKAAILSIPRDTYVPIAGTNRQDRINSAFNNGPEQLIDTIHQAFGIQIDHYAEVDFEGFKGIVDVVGPINVYFPAPARDDFSGLHQKTAGCIPLYGEGALSYVRARHFEYFEGGKWHSDPTGDIGRISRQQDFIRRVMRQAINKGARNPFTLNALIGKAVHAVTVDSSFSTSDMTRLAKRFKSLEPDAVDMFTLPGDPANIGGASVLRVNQAQARDVINRFLGVDANADQSASGNAATLPKVLPASVRVRVLNGTGGAGQATQVAGDLNKAGFNVAGTGDADSFRYIQPVIKYGQGQKDKALYLQAFVQGGVQVREDLTLRGIDLVFITGSDYAGIKAPAGTAAASTSSSSTTTTAKAATATTKPANAGAAPQPQC
ncbi:MAG TPA: LCP family protein [Acidimicrobiales bacterium]|nr:LCP family protein [Acidimicrobiales bacterium]